MKRFRYKCLHSFKSVEVINEIAIGQGEELQGKTLVIYRYTKSALSEVMEYKEFYKNFKRINDDQNRD